MSQSKDCERGGGRRDGGFRRNAIDIDCESIISCDCRRRD